MMGRWVLSPSISKTLVRLAIYLVFKFVLKIGEIMLMQTLSHDFL